MSTYWRYIVVAGIVSMIIAALGVGVGLLRKSGADEERQTIERANDDASRKADQRTNTLQECVAGGGDWDRTNGVCIKH